MDAKCQAAVDIVRRLRAEGFQAYLVGGCVRDLVMGREPKDYDISTEATPEAIVRLYPESLTVGAQFGVVLVPREAGDVEVATFRSDGRYTDGRHPDQVRYSKTAEEDVRRRDFTINGLLYDPLAAPAAAPTDRLDEAGLLKEVLPEIKALQGVQQPPEFHPEGDVWTHTLMMLEGLRNPTPTLALGVLLHDVGKPPTFSVRERIRFDNHVEVGARMAEAICGRLRLPSRETERVAELVRHHLRFKDFPEMRRSTQLRFLRLPGFDEHLELHRLDCLSSHRDLTNYELARRMLEETPPQEIKPAPLVRGDDLITQGYEPGPLFKQILQTVEDAQLEGKVRSREDALELVAEQFPLQQP